jgi:hypothetical protein
MLEMVSKLQAEPSTNSKMQIVKEYSSQSEIFSERKIMGYNTKYRLEIEPFDEGIWEII